MLEAILSQFGKEFADLPELGDSGVHIEEVSISHGEPDPVFDNEVARLSDPDNLPGPEEPVYEAGMQPILGTKEEEPTEEMSDFYAQELRKVWLQEFISMSPEQLRSGGNKLPAQSELTDDEIDEYRMSIIAEYAEMDLESFKIRVATFNHLNQENNSRFKPPESEDPSIEDMTFDQFKAYLDFKKFSLETDLFMHARKIEQEIKKEDPKTAEFFEQVQAEFTKGRTYVNGKPMEHRYIALTDIDNFGSSQEVKTKLQSVLTSNMPNP